MRSDESDSNREQSDHGGEDCDYLPSQLQLQIHFLIGSSIYRFT